MTGALIARLRAPFPAAASHAIEALRVFLVAEVFGGHLLMIAVPDYHRLDLHRWPDRIAAVLHLALRFGQQAAYVFVFFSGFFIVPRLVTIARGDEVASPVPFLRYRFARIYPTLVLAIALTLACDTTGMVGLGAAGLYRAHMTYDPVAALAPGIAIGNLLSLQPTFVSALGSNGPLWTLGYLVQFYVAGILLACGWARHRAATAVLAAIVLVAAAWWRPEWLLLFLAWSLAPAARLVVPRRPAAVWLLVPAALAFVAANRLPPLGTIVLATIAAWLFVIALAAPRPPSGRPASRTIAWLSGLSYAIYAVHFPIAMLVYVVLALLLGTGPVLWLPYAIATAASVLGCAWLVERAVARYAAWRAAWRAARS